MRNEIAEWLISRAAPPELARTIVGDLLEAQLGPVEFWVAVLRATVSIVTHQPWRVGKALSWFAYEPAYYGLLVGLDTTKLRHVFPQVFALLVFAAVVWTAWKIRLIWSGRRMSSVLMITFATFLLWHIGLGMIALLLSPTIPFAWWGESRNRRTRAHA